MNMKKFFINPLEYISINLIKKIIFSCFAILFILRLIDLFSMQKFLSPFVYEEWLINYSQGFVRRGLSGSILLFLNNYGLDTFQILKWCSYLIVLFFSGMYLLQVKLSNKVLDLKSLMVVLFLPSLIFFPLHDHINYNQHFCFPFILFTQKFQIYFADGLYRFILLYYIFSPLFLHFLF